MDSSRIGYVADFYQGSLQIGDEAPNFTCDSHLGTITFHDVIDGQVSVLVTFPRDFDAVATTEMGMIAKLKEEFEARNVNIFALSVDTKTNHRRWIEDIEILQDCQVAIPLICDVDGMISRAYGLVRPDDQEEDDDDDEYPRQQQQPKAEIIPAGLIIITDIDRRIKYTSQYPSTIGRNFYEVLRIIDALHLTRFHKVSTPAHWKQGEDVFVANEVTSSVVAKSMFTKGFVAIREWFRITPQPDGGEEDDD